MEQTEQTALVTGTSSGFGLLTAVSLAKAGMRVFATMRDLNRRGELDEAAAAAGVMLEVVALDVTKPETITEAITQIGPVDILVNNAGATIIGSFENTSMVEFREILETNVVGPVAVMKAVLSGMRERRKGRIINVASVAGRVGVAGLAAYATSKHALVGLSDVVRREVRQFGIEVVLIEPGAFPTPAVKSPRVSALSGGVYEDMERAVGKMLEESSESADPQRVADAIVRAATARKPRQRYVVGGDARAVFTMHSLLPNRAFEAILRSKMKPRTP